MENAERAREIIIEVTERNFEAEVLGAGVPVLLDFTATWCAPCRALKPILAKLASEGAGRFKVALVDGDENPGLAARFGVKGFPTTIAFAGGKEIGRQVGVTTKERLLRLVGDEAARD
jgi:thioredoxin 1